jgi:hypothetical protein
MLADPPIKPVLMTRDGVRLAHFDAGPRQSANPKRSRPLRRAISSGDPR